MVCNAVTNVSILLGSFSSFCFFFFLSLGLTSDYHSKIHALFKFRFFVYRVKLFFTFPWLPVIRTFSCIYVSFNSIAIGLYGFDDIIHNFDAFTVVLNLWLCLTKFGFAPPALIDADTTAFTDRCVQRTAHTQPQMWELVKGFSVTQTFVQLH